MAQPLGQPTWKAAYRVAAFNGTCHFDGLGGPSYEIEETLLHSYYPSKFSECKGDGLQSDWT